MKKIIVATVIFLLIISTALIKNSAKKNEDKIFTAKENITTKKLKKVSSKNFLNINFFIEIWIFCSYIALNL